MTAEFVRAREEILRYVESQVAEGSVRHLERVAVEHVAGRRHEVWDVHLQEGERWWAVTNPTNLYPQADFKSRDVVLTFHVGLAVRLLTRDRVPLSEAAIAMFAPVWRRWEQAADALATGEQSEHFQAVGTHLRECLISLAHEIADDTLHADGASRPKTSDVVAWVELVVDAAATGAGDARLRGYIKSLVRTTWDYQQHLLHNKNALRLDAEIGLQAVAHLLSVLTAVVVRSVQKPRRCGACDAYGLAGGVCQHCGWNDPDHEAPTVPHRSEEEMRAALEEPHTLTSEISTLITVADLAVPKGADSSLAVCPTCGRDTASRRR